MKNTRPGLVRSSRSSRMPLRNVSLERNIADQETELAKARQSAQEARVEAQGALQEIQEAKKIAVGKAFIMQSKYVKKRYLLLTRI